MNTIMSTTLLPDIYRHTARKSTVSRNVKTPSKIHAYNNNHNTNAKNFKDEQSIFDTIERNIKFEQDLLQNKQLIILPENEIEQINTDENIVVNILEDILKQISEQIIHSNQCRTISADTRHVIDSVITHIDMSNIENITDQSMSSVNDVPMEDIQSNHDDDIVEIDPLTSNVQSRSCTCQCHQSTSNSFNDYSIFEQALQQTRHEHQQTIKNNQLIQILKDQHQELLNLYYRQLHANKIDQEQQTNQLEQHDQNIQTDLLPLSQTIKSHSQINCTYSSSNAKIETTISQVNNHFSSIPIRTTGPSLQQIIPCLTTTTAMKTSMIKKQPQIISTNNSHDIVDLTEEDDDNEQQQQHINSIQTSKINSISQQSSPASAIQNQRSNLVSVPNLQPSIRTLADHNPCDYTIARPQLTIAHDNATVRLTWNLPATPMESILNYEIFAYKQTHNLTNSDWKKIGTVKSMRLPMAVTLKEFQANSHYAFAVRAISVQNNLGPFCEPKTIFTGNSISDHY